MKFGLVGTGRWGRNYLRTIKSIEGSEVVLACSRDPLKYLDVPREIIVPWTKKYQEVLESDIDTVIIATHPDAHFEIARAALSKGINVICEKPCMLDDNQYAELYELTKGYKQFFFTNYINQFASINPFIHQAIRENHGCLLELANVGHGPWRSYSSLWDYGCHEVFLAFYLNQQIDYTIRNVSSSKGSYSFTMQFDGCQTNIICGNEFPSRSKSISLGTGKSNIVWVDDKSENLLLKMLQQAIEGKLLTNLMYSQMIDRVIKRVEQ
jgi:predicted dehydrogenase